MPTELIELTDFFCQCQLYLLLCKKVAFCSTFIINEYLILI